METNQFDSKGMPYKKYRPTYPNDVLNHLISEQIITQESVVADIGSGTGIFTMQLQPFVKTVYAVEPNEDMRKTAERDFQNKVAIHSIHASAEKTTLSDNSIDCITAAQAFHWFDRDSFKKECQRILKPHGHVVLIWNDRNQNDPIIKENAKINAAFCAKFKGFSNGINLEDPQQFNEFFTGFYQVLNFEYTVEYDLETFIGRNMSSSFAPHKDDPNNHSYAAALTKLFFAYEENGLIKYPYTVRCYIGTV